MNIQQNFFCFFTFLLFLTPLISGQIKIDNNVKNSDYFINIDSIISTKLINIKDKKNKTHDDAVLEKIVSDKIPTLINQHHFKMQSNFLNGTYTNSVGYTKSFQNKNPTNTYLAKNIALSLMNQKNTISFAPCHPTGATICPDVIELPILLTFDRYFALNHQDYLFELLGFNMNELDFKRGFIADNDPMKRVRLYGKTTFLPDVVPIPNTIILFLTGLWLVCITSKNKKSI